MVQSSFIHDFAPGAIHFGRKSIEDVGELLLTTGSERAMIVCGRNVGENPVVRNSLIDTVGDRLASYYDETSADKTIKTAYHGVEVMAEENIDALIGVGGGSSLDIATVMRLLHADYRPLEQIRAEVKETGSITLRSDHNSLVPLFVVPTTFAGADLSTGAGVNVTFEDGTIDSASVIEKPLMPDALVYDPDLYSSTPSEALTASAMNGFNKGIEALYSRHATPITDGTASHGLSYLSSALPALSDDVDGETLDNIVTGMLLVQYGVSVPERMKLAILHAFGHAFRDHGVQQGLGHAVITPEVLQFVFERVDGRRSLIASSLGVEKKNCSLADAIVDEVAYIRDELELPSQIRNLGQVSRSDFSTLAARTHEDHCLNNAPENLNPTVDELEAILEAAW